MWGEQNVSLLVVAIKFTTYNFDRHKHQSHALHDANRNFCRYYQTGHTTKPQYLKIFKNMVSIIDFYGVSIRAKSGLVKSELTAIAKNSSYSTDAERQRAAEAEKKKYLGLAMMLFDCFDRSKMDDYSELMKEVAE